MTDLTEIRNTLHHALNAEEAAKSELDEAEKIYEATFAEFKKQNAGIVTRLNNARDTYTKAKSVVSKTRDIAKEALSSSFIDELPEGFSQNRGKQVIYDAQGLRKQALEHFHHLLVLDEKEVEYFFTAMAKEQKDGSLLLSENIRSLASVEVVFKPDARISNATISKLDIPPVAQSPVDESDSADETATAVEDMDLDSEDQTLAVFDEQIARDDEAADYSTEYILEQIPGNLNNK